jgi:hypothetical protein
MNIFNLFTTGIFVVWLAVLQSLRAAKRQLEPVPVSHKK